MLATIYSQGTPVRWQWGDDYVSGTIERSHESTVRRHIGGASITRHGTSANPAYEVVLEDGSRVLKSHLEIERDF